MILNTDSKTIENYIQCVIDSDLVIKEKISCLEEGLEACLNEKIVIDVIKLQSFINSIDLNINVNLDRFGTLYLEYILLIQNERGLKCECPEIFIEKIDSEEWNALYALWRSSV